MSQSFIDALMHFFALLYLPLPGKKISNLRQKLYDYFEKAAIIFPAENCLKIYNTYSRKYFFELSGQTYRQEDDPANIRKHLLHDAAIKTQGNLYLQERLLLVMALLEFSETYFREDKQLRFSIHDLCRSLNLTEEDYREAYGFVTSGNTGAGKNELFAEEASGMNEDLEGVWVDMHKQSSRQKRDSFAERIHGNILFHYFERFNYLVFRYYNAGEAFLNERKIYPGYFYTLHRNDSIVFTGKEPIRYSEIEEAFHIDRPPVITLSGKDLSYRYGGTNYSIKPFSFSENSGQLIGIIGNNGVGKSTILRLISNQMDPVSGKIYVNGNDLREHRYKLSPTLAFIPQEDLIIPELTVSENLMYQAHLSMGNLGLREIRKRVNNTLQKLDLEEVAHLRAGKDHLHRVNDFKRICIRLALELIRDPYLIFLDEPLCSLSYSDSRRIISILKNEAYNGKLIILTSQIPTAEIFNMFDRVWLIDQDGYLIYSGEPARSLDYFRSTGLLPYHYIQSDSTQLSAEDVIKVVETKKIHTDGSVSDERQVAPGTWYDAWREKSGRPSENPAKKEEKPVPILPSNLPGIEKQFLVYLLRNLMLKFRNVSYLLLNFAGIPAVAVLLAWSIRTIYGNEYTFSQNEYLPLYLFLSVNFIIFGGLLTGAEEIYRERPLIRRDMYLNISLFSYKNSKLFFLILVSFVQTLIYTLAGNFVLGIKGMLPVYLFIFFSLAVFANLLALSLSAAIQKLNNIYIVIPFLLIPNLLFSGFLIRFDNYSQRAVAGSSVPVVAELTPSRWAFEALMFEQFAHNPFSKYFFRSQKKLYESRYILENILPELERYLAECRNNPEDNPDSKSPCLTILRNELSQLGEYEEIAPFEKLSTLKTVDSIDEDLFRDIYGYLTYVRFLMENHISEAEDRIQETTIELTDSLSNVPFEEFRDENRNVYVESWLYNKDSVSLYTPKNKLFKRGIPAYLRPESPTGRAQFFASEKKLRDQYMSTFRFNLSILWFLNLVMYLIFLTDTLKYLLRFLSTRKELYD